MIERYTLPEMGAIWSEKSKLETWKEVGVLALEAVEQQGKVAAGDASSRGAPKRRATGR